MPERRSYGKVIPQTGCLFSLRESFSGEGNLAAKLFPSRRKLVMSVEHFPFPG